MKFDLNLVIFSTEDYNWSSCRYIEDNLLYIYRLKSSDNMIFIDIYNLSFQDIRKKLKNYLSDYRSINLILTSFKTNSLFLEEITKDFPESMEISIRWHVYANFINLLQTDQNLNLYLSRYRFSIVPLSKRFSNLIAAYFYGKPPLQSFGPFPIFLPSKTTNLLVKKTKSKFELRKKYNIPDVQKIICYSGRLSFQKNISSLLKLFQKLLNQDDNFTLVLIGAFDDIGLPEIGLSLTKNAYNTYLMNIFNQLPQNTQNKVIFLGDVSSELLPDIYKEVNVFVSLSTCTQEDYGVSPIEALQSGVPVILTDWGGFPEIKMQFKKYVDLIPIDLKDGNIYLDEHVFLNSLKKFSLTNKNEVIKYISSKTSLKKSQITFSTLQFKYQKLNLKKQTPFTGKQLPSLRISAKLTPEEVKNFHPFINRKNILTSRAFSLTFEWADYLNFYFNKNNIFVKIKKNKSHPWFSQIPCVEYVPTFTIEEFKNTGHSFVLIKDDLKKVKSYLKKADSAKEILLPIEYKKLISIPINLKKRISFYEKKQVLKELKIRKKILIVLDPKEETKKEFLNWASKLRTLGQFDQVHILNGQNKLFQTQIQHYEKLNFKHYSWGRFLYSRNFNEYEIIHYPKSSSYHFSYPEEYVLDRGGKISSRTIAKKMKAKKIFRISPKREIMIY